VATTASEISRLGKLAEYQVLDTAPEKEFDEITQVAAALLGTPISLVSLVDRDRQWFKARYGLGAEQTPREQAFCAHAIESDDVYIVDDATKNPLFADNPLVTGAPDIRFYAGAPLITPDKFRLGTLCVIDTKPREGLTEVAEKTLALLARMVINALESRRQTLRAQHQAKLMTQLAETLSKLSQAGSLTELAKVLGEGARGLIVGDAVVVHLLPRAATTQQDFVVTRGATTDQAPPAVPWQTRGAALIAKKSGALVTVKDLPPEATGGSSKGSWVGFLIGLDRDNPIGYCQLWRQYTTSFTDLETSMLTNLARVASSVAERLIGR